MITWRSKKQIVVARSSAKVEYRAIAHTSCELMWIKHLLEELRFVVKLPMTMHCDNQAAIYIASNPVFHERTKHIEVDCHIVGESRRWFNCYSICFYKSPDCWFVYQSFM